MRILDERREVLISRERALLEKFTGFLKDFGAPAEDVELVRRARSDLEELFLLVVVGEFNSGKSAFINALLGAEISEEGVTPTTDRITVLRHSAEPVRQERRDRVLEKGYPNAFLHEIAIVDTPGTNAIIRHHEELSRGFVPRSDLVLLCYLLRQALYRVRARVPRADPGLGQEGGPRRQQGGPPARGRRRR